MINRNILYLGGLVFWILIHTSCDSGRNNTIKKRKYATQKQSTPLSMDRDTQEIEESKALPDKSIVITKDAPVLKPNDGLSIADAMLPFSGGFLGGGNGALYRDANYEGDDDEEECGCQCEGNCQAGTASFINDDPSTWYDINTPIFPSTVLLSINQNSGFGQGSVTTLPTGLKIAEGGTYWASFTAILANYNYYETLFPIFLVANGNYDPTNQSLQQLGAIGSFPTLINTVQATGILKDLPAETSLSLVANNIGGTTEPIMLGIISWSIQVYKICD